MNGRDTGLLLLMYACDERLTYNEKQTIKQIAMPSYSTIMLASNTEQNRRIHELKEEIKELTIIRVRDAKIEMRRRAQEKNK
jgi:3'-phosphoadenosine 5'-phosphosulfate sulfotransferase